MASPCRLFGGFVSLTNIFLDSGVGCCLFVLTQPVNQTKQSSSRLKLRKEAALEQFHAVIFQNQTDIRTNHRQADNDNAIASPWSCWSFHQTSPNLCPQRPTGHQQMVCLVCPLENICTVNKFHRDWAFYHGYWLYIYSLWSQLFMVTPTPACYFRFTCFIPMPEKPNRNDFLDSTSPENIYTLGFSRRQIWVFCWETFWSRGRSLLRPFSTFSTQLKGVSALSVFCHLDFNRRSKWTSEIDMHCAVC